jgi:hypothetical protein
VKWEVTGCRLIHTYGRLPWEKTEVGVITFHLGAKHGGEEGMWVDAASAGSEQGKRKVGAHGGAGMQ